MRFQGDDEMFPGQWWLWEESLRRAMNGKRGQQALRDLRDELLAMPEKVLIEGRLSDGKNVCTVGALVVHRRVQAGEDREAVLADLCSKITWDEEYGPDDQWEADDMTLCVAMQAGVARTLAVDMAGLNDDFYRSSPEERYEKVLSWVEARIIEEPVAA